ncbi:MAG: 2-oxo-4-hydroxy-4-carboxy-5-ureidoimidazoline decarboxylase [Acidobacteriota bacterium]|nr:2-oxo-4-hydroxy-4-carboxy-5-ureidoimidazoline decarboxylase [Acidobacteriota bacterium]
MSNNLQTTLNRLNSLNPDQAENEFLKCCGSVEWAKRMIVERPFQDFDDLIAKAERVWWLLEPHDWLEAFQSHPKIGQKRPEQQTSPEAQAWSEQEQSGTRNSTRKTVEALEALNNVYEEKFGHIFIVYATGKTSEEMLAILRLRLENSPDEELRNAAAEQAQITQLRLKKLLTI